MKIILIIASAWLTILTHHAWAACDDRLMERLIRAEVPPDKIKSICLDDEIETASSATLENVSKQVTANPAVVTPKETKSDGNKHGFDTKPLLESHFPTSVGMTKDSDDEWFLDANVSLRYPLMYEGYAKKGCNRFNVLPYFAFTGRFGQYIGTRESSPVVMKAFNPELFIRIFMSPDEMSDASGKADLMAICEKEGDLAYYNDRVRQARHNAKEGERENIREIDNKLKSKKYLSYVDVLYGHLSNGQGISDMNSLRNIFSTLGARKKEEFAKDYISRGWDYVGIAWTKKLDEGDSFYLRLDKYIGGFLQHKIEEDPWELNPLESLVPGSKKIKRLQQVSGLKARYATDKGDNEFNVVATWDTGVQSPFRYNTARLEVIKKCEFLGVPAKFWVQQGYNSDLAQYYKSVKSYGFTLQFSTSNNH